MTKQTDRLTRVEERVINIDKKLDALFNKFDNYLTEAQEGRIDCAKQQSATDVQTKIQWGFIGFIILGLIGLALNKLAL